MSLNPGVRLGAYEIVALLGSGGMGEVYRARDPRLGRDVAIKVRGAFGADADRLRRFEQEARAAAALNHPNILAVHDVGTADTSGAGGSPVPYVVSELLEGETLRERLHGGPLPVRKAIDAAVQIANGLAAAHEKGIVHRDLKPENVFITEDGRVKILDFGLAKLTEREPALSGMSAMPTAPPDTLPGVVLGTIGYMAPEQVRGRATDHRSDIFAFGTILYEMLSGRRAFHADTSADTMTAILKEDPPDLPAAERHIPPALARIVDRCLEKSPAARFQSAGDLAFALEALTSASSSAAHAAADSAGAAHAPRANRLPWTLTAVFALLFVAAGAVALSLFVGRQPSNAQPITFSMNMPDGWMLEMTATGGAPASPLSVSPDGRRVAFLARNAENRTALWVRGLDALTPQLLPSTDGALAPFWSPDSRFVAFFASGKLKKIDVTGGPAVTVCDAPNGIDGAWGREGVVLFAIVSGDVTPLYRVSASGGIPAPATTLQKSDQKHIRPHFFPDGRHFLFRMGTALRARTFAGALDSQDRAPLVETDSTDVLYSAGHLLFVRETTLMAQPFDARKLALTGEPFPIAEPILMLPSPSATFAMFSASETGVLAYLTGTAAVLPRLTWRDRRGTNLGTVGDGGAYADLALSPDGHLAAVTLPDAVQTTRDIWIVDLVRGVRTRFTFDQADDLSPVWSPDGNRIVFGSRRKGHFDLYVKPSGGAGAEEVLYADDVDKIPTSWSADGHFILFSTFSASSTVPSALGTTGGTDIWVLPTTGDRKAYPFVASRFNEAFGRFSPDGRWVTYASNESGRNEVYAVPFPGPGGKWEISTEGGSFPRFRSDGREILYRVLSSGQIASAAVHVDGSSLVVGDVKNLFFASQGGSRNFFELAPDGQRVLVNSAAQPDASSAARPLTVVVNWLAAVRR